MPQKLSGQVRRPTSSWFGKIARKITASPDEEVYRRASMTNIPHAIASITVAIGTNPGGGTLSGTTTVAAVSGVATFSTLSINAAGAGYTLNAASGALTGAVIPVDAGLTA